VEAVEATPLNRRAQDQDPDRYPPVCPGEADSFLVV
jgi:hypothetical protein